MVEIIRENRRPSTGQMLARGLAQGVDAGAKAYVDYSQMQEENRRLKEQTGLDLSGIQDPNTRQQLLANKLRQGERLRETAGTGLLDDGQASFDPLADQRGVNLKADQPKQLGIDRVKTGKQQDSLLDFGQEDSDERDLYPEMLTKENKIKPPSYAETKQKASKIRANSARNGNPISEAEALQLAAMDNALIDQHNAQVDEALAEQEATQEKWGDIALEELNKLEKPKRKRAYLQDEGGEEWDPEVQALFKRQGEELARTGKFTSKTAFQKEMAKRAREFSNKVDNITNAVKSPGILDKIKDKFGFDSVKYEDAKNDIRLQIKPLLDDGLYDFSRDLLDGLEYNPEQIEDIITNLSEGTKRNVSKIPQFRPQESISFQKGYAEILPYNKKLNEEQQKQFKENLYNVLQSDPSANLILLRQAYERKGVDWRTFKNHLNDMIFNGDFALDPQQDETFYILEQPPLGHLEKILDGVDLR